MVRRRRNGELRTRTGCNTCRDRRVKCPEEKPACSTCVSLGHACSYARLLRWQVPQEYDGTVLPHENVVDEWMFLHAHVSDFDKSNQRPYLVSSSRVHKGALSASAEDIQHEAPTSHDDLQLGGCISPMTMSLDELYLWDYFRGAIAPSCVLNPSVNPYQDIFLPMAASTGKTLPLFNIVMAIAARERAILGDGKYQNAALRYHHQAVCLLRRETAKIENGGLDQISLAQVLATVMALVFLDIMSNCSEWWVIHSDFARSLVHRFRTSQPACDSALEALFNFVGSYIVVHEVYAHTAWSASVSTSYTSINDMSDNRNLQTLTGCSANFLQILADVNSLAAESAINDKLDYVDPDTLQVLENRRYNLEKRLHDSAWHNDPDDPSEEGSDTSSTIELKRLTGLLHLYARIDHLGPCDPCVSHLATQILYLLAKAPTRSNIILWPLFMVATLGIGIGRDSERAFILLKLDQLLRKRQMRYIKKARDIAIKVWKIRDLNESGLQMGWNILDQVTGNERVSLL